METVLRFFLEFIPDPEKMSIVCLVYITAYYVVSAFSLNAAKKGSSTSIWRKNGALDIATSVTWIIVAIMLISSFLEQCNKNQLTLGYLVLYYIYFLFIFAFCYGLLEWHFNRSLDGVDSNTWEAELQYLLLSVGVQTTLGYFRAKPVRLAAEILAASQALLGLFFVVVFIAKTINTMS